MFELFWTWKALHQTAWTESASDSGSFSVILGSNPTQVWFTFAYFCVCFYPYMYEPAVLRIFGPKRDEVTGE
jgi:hypothetical protein